MTSPTSGGAFFEYLAILPVGLAGPGRRRTSGNDGRDAKIKRPSGWRRSLAGASNRLNRLLMLAGRLAQRRGERNVERPLADTERRLFALWGFSSRGEAFGS